MKRIIVLTCNPKQKSANKKPVNQKPVPPTEAKTAINTPIQTAAMVTELCILKAENEELIEKVQSLTKQLAITKKELNDALRIICKFIGD